MENFNLLKHVRNHDEDSSVLWLFNIGVEKFWSQDISTVRSGNDECIVNHMEEMNLLITRVQDYLILRKKPNPQFIEMLRQRGFEIPHILVPSFEDESLSISEIVLEDQILLEQLKEIKEKQKLYFVPYGVSQLEETIAEEIGIELIGGPNDVAKMINNKIFARNVSNLLGFPNAEGCVCHSIDEVREASEKLLEKYEKIIIKYPTGVSGKGLWVLDGAKKLNTTMMVIKRICDTKYISEDFIVEGWCKKKCDLNYQIYVGKDGSVETFSIKEQLLNETVYIGSLIPPRISEEVVKQCKECGEKIGKLLYEKGYNGLLGVDAMITDEDIFIPIIEINARFTLSTYISFLLDDLDSKMQLSFYRKVTLCENVRYDTEVDHMKEIIGDEQAFIYTSETVCYETVGQYGRQFTTVFGDTVDQLLKIHSTLTDS